jgi:hypothetical protein
MKKLFGIDFLGCGFQIMLVGVIVSSVLVYHFV